MHIIKATTLVDITNTNVVRIRDNNTHEYHQQQNLNVLLQIIGLRTQPFEPTVKKYHDVQLTGTMFGFVYHNQISDIWELKFQIEGESVWQENDDMLYWLRQDVHGVAITSDLDNHIDFAINIFDTKNNANILFEFD